MSKTRQDKTTRQDCRKEKRPQPPHETGQSTRNKTPSKTTREEETRQEKKREDQEATKRRPREVQEKTKKRPRVDQE
jgi:hypothetical protein